VSFFPPPAALALVIEIDRVFGLREWLLSNEHPCWGFNDPTDQLGLPDVPANLGKDFDHLIPRDIAVTIDIAKRLHPEATSSQTLLGVEADHVALLNRSQEPVVICNHAEGIDAAALVLLREVLALYVS